MGEAQAGLIGFVEVVEHQHGTAVGGGQPQQLGDGHEEPLVSAFAAPVQVSAGQGPLDLGPVVVVEPVEQGGMAPAEIGDGLQDRRVGPGAFDSGGHPAACSPPPRLGFASGPSQQRRLAYAGGTGQQQRASALAVTDRPEKGVDQRALVVPADQVVLDSGRGLGRPGVQEGVAQSDRLLARRHTQLASQGPVEPLELAKRPVPVAPRRQGAHELQMGLFVGPIELHEVVPAAKSPQQVGAQLADPLSRAGRPLLVEILGQQVASAAVGRGLEQRLVSGPEGLVRGGLEQGHVDRDELVGEQGDRLAPQDNGVVPGGFAGEMGGLVQPGCGLVHGQVGPERVDHLLAVQPSPGAQRQQLDQRGGVAAAPGAGRDGPAVSAHLECPQQPDLDRHR